jgi:hypothetical protein
VCAAFVDEDEAAVSEAPYPLAPARPLGLVALGGEERLFF